MKVHELTGIKGYDDGHLFGLEFEVESQTKYDFSSLNLKLWATKEDASLRHQGVEIVSRGALLEKTRQEAVIDVCNWINKNKPILKSPRTSVHVHFNCTNMNVLEVYNMVISYWILEDLFFDYFGDIRRTSPFCLPISASENFLSSVMDSMKRDNPLEYFEPNMAKYSGLNMCPLTKYNTIEFRGLGGVYNAAAVNSWLEAIKNIREFSSKFKTPDAILDYAYNKQPQELIDAILPKGSFFNFVLSKTEKNTPCISNSVCLLTEAAYNTDWKEPDKVPKPKKKNREDVWVVAEAAGGGGGQADFQAFNRLIIDDLPEPE